MAEDLVFDAASLLLDCVCTALFGSLGGSPCRCSLYPGSTPTADFCGGAGGCGGESPCPGSGGAGHGQASIVVRRVFPVSARFPFPESEPKPCCQVDRLAVEFAVTVHRCAPTPDASGAPPDAARLTDAVAVLLDDAAQVRSAVVCCFQQARGCSRPVLLGDWRPEHTSGGCMGGTTTLVAEVLNCACED